MLNPPEISPARCLSLFFTLVPESPLIRALQGSPDALGGFASTEVMRFRSPDFSTKLAGPFLQQDFRNRVPDLVLAEKMIELENDQVDRRFTTDDVRIKLKKTMPANPKRIRG